MIDGSSSNDEDYKLPKDVGKLFKKEVLLDKKEKISCFCFESKKLGILCEFFEYWKLLLDFDFNQKPYGFKVYYKPSIQKLIDTLQEFLDKINPDRKITKENPCDHLELNKLNESKYKYIDQKGLIYKDHSVIWAFTIMMSEMITEKKIWDNMIVGDKLEPIEFYQRISNFMSQDNWQEIKVFKICSWRTFLQGVIEKKITDWDVLQKHIDFMTKHHEKIIKFKKVEVYNECLENLKKLAKFEIDIYDIDNFLIHYEENKESLEIKVYSPEYTSFNYIEKNNKEFLNTHKNFSTKELVNVLIRYLNYNKKKRDLIHGNLKKTKILYDPIRTRFLVTFVNSYDRDHSKGNYMYYSLKKLRDPTRRTEYDDIWAALIIVYEIIVGEHPFKHVKNFHSFDEFMELSEEAQKEELMRTARHIKRDTNILQRVIDGEIDYDDLIQELSNSSYCIHYDMPNINKIVLTQAVVPNQINQH